MEEAKSPVRFDYLDIARGLAILLVIVGHSPYVPWYVADFVYGFHMPLFFFVSGLFISKHLEQPFPAFLKGKARAYLLPYFSYSLAKEVFYILRSRSLNLPRFLGIFIQWPGTEYSNPLWFFTTLFVANLIFYGIYHLSLTFHRLKVPLSTVILAAAALVFHHVTELPLPWFLDAACIILPYLTFGWIISLWGLQSFTQKLNLRNLLVSFLGAALSIAVYHLITGSRIFYNSCDLHEPISGYLAGFFGILLLCCLGKLLQRSRVLKYIGFNSLFYYLFHLRGVGLSRKITAIGGIQSPMILLLSDLFFAMIVPLPAIFLIKNYFYLFFGLKKPKKPFRLFRKKA